MSTILAEDLQSQRDELLASLKEAHHYLLFHESANSVHMMRIAGIIAKMETEK